MGHDAVPRFWVWFSLACAVGFAGCTDSERKFPQKKAEDGQVDGPSALDAKVKADRPAKPDARPPKDSRPTLEQGSPDVSSLDLWPLDQSPPLDHGLPPDVALAPDLTPPDLAPPLDQPPPDLMQPDQEPPDLMQPDLLPPDLVPPPDFGCTSSAQCDDKLICTTDTCSGGKCSASLKAGYCFIGGACALDGAPNPTNQCQVCDTSVSTSAWSLVQGKKCDDNKACTYNDVCTYGVCAGTAYTCDDKISCTVDTCTGAGPAPTGCKHTMASGYCLIAGKCHADGASMDACHKCITSKSTTAWSKAISGWCTATFAGSGAKGFSNGAALSAAFNYPYGVAVHTDGTVYVADLYNYRIRKIAGGVVSTLAGSGVSGYQDGAAASAQFRAPMAVEVDKAGKVYVGDENNTNVRVVWAGVVSKINPNVGPAGLGLQTPSGVDIDSAGKVYIADYGHHRIRMYFNLKVTTIAGYGTPGSYDGPALYSQFDYPTGLAVDDAGNNVYVGDCRNQKVRLVAGGKVTTFAGTGKAGHKDGPVATAMFYCPWDVDTDNKGKVFVSDRINQRIRMIQSGNVSTIAGYTKYTGHADGKNAQFNNPRGIAVDSAGRIYVADTQNNRIRIIYP